MIYSRFQYFYDESRSLIVPSDIKEFRISNPDLYGRDVYIKAMLDNKVQEFYPIIISNQDYNSHYFLGATIINSDSTQDGKNWRGTNATEGKFWDGQWNNSAGGVHGDIIIDNFTLSHKVMNNTMSRQGNYNNITRPIMRFDMYGYQHDGNNADGTTTSGYCRQSGFIFCCIISHRH